MKVGEAERNLRCYGGSEKHGKLGPHPSVKSTETVNPCRSPQGPRGGSVVSPPHPQSRTGTHESTLIPKRGQSTRKVFTTGRSDLMTKGQRVLKDRGLHLRTQQGHW